MALVDDIEYYGRAVDEGTTTRDAAVGALVEAGGGGLTRVGAGTAIDQWKTVRASYEQEFKRAGVEWARCHGIDA
jgi:hypothetical protein